MLIVGLVAVDIVSGAVLLGYAGLIGARAGAPIGPLVGAGLGITACHLLWMGIALWWGGATAWSDHLLGWPLLTLACWRILEFDPVLVGPFIGAALLGLAGPAARAWCGLPPFRSRVLAMPVGWTLAALLAGGLALRLTWLRDEALPLGHDIGLLDLFRRPTALGIWLAMGMPLLWRSWRGWRRAMTWVPVWLLPLLWVAIPWGLAGGAVFTAFWLEGGNRAHHGATGRRPVALVLATLAVFLGVGAGWLPAGWCGRHARPAIMLRVRDQLLTRPEYAERTEYVAASRFRSDRQLRGACPTCLAADRHRVAIYACREARNQLAATLTSSGGAGLIGSAPLPCPYQQAVLAEGPELRPVEPAWRAIPGYHPEDPCEVTCAWCDEHGL